MLTDEAILHTSLLHRDNAALATKALLQATLDAGGIDNVTVVARLASYTRQIVEGSPEWDVMYRKTSEEEQKKRAKP